MEKVCELLLVCKESNLFFSGNEMLARVVSKCAEEMEGDQLSEDDLSMICAAGSNSYSRIKDRIQRQVGVKL